MSLSSLRLALWSFDIFCKVVPPLNGVARALNVYILSLSLETFCFLFVFV